MIYPLHGFGLSGVGFRGVDDPVVGRMPVPRIMPMIGCARRSALDIVLEQGHDLALAAATTALT